MTKLIKSLDLEEFIKAFKSFLSRDKELFLQGDTKLHLCFIKELESLQFTPPPLVQNLDSQLALLKKFGFLKLDEIFEFVKIVRYFNYLKGLKLEGRLGKWINSIDLPLNILEITKAFLENGSLRSGIYLELDSIVVGIERVKKDIEQSHIRLSCVCKIGKVIYDLANFDMGWMLSPPSRYRGKVGLTNCRKLHRACILVLSRFAWQVHLGCRGMPRHYRREGSKGSRAI